MKDLAIIIIERYMSSNLNVKVNEEEDVLKAYYEKYGEKWEPTHKLDVDVPDDVWTLYIGINKEKN